MYIGVQCEHYVGLYGVLSEHCIGVYGCIFCGVGIA